MFFDFLAKAWQGQGMGTANIKVPEKNMQGKFPEAPNMLFLSVVTGVRITQDSLDRDRTQTLQTIQASVLARQGSLAADASDKLRVSFKAVVIVMEVLIEDEETTVAEDAEEMMAA